MSTEEAQMNEEAQKRKAILAIMLDSTLTEADKARKRQELMMGTWVAKNNDSPASGATTSKGATATGKTAATDSEAAIINLDENLKCAICMDLCERPVTAPCQHSFCLQCFKKWTNQNKKTCPNCRADFPKSWAQNPRINTALTVAIRLARNPTQASGTKETKETVRIEQEQRPDEAFTTERAVRNGRANAASGRIMVEIPSDHFGPIEAQHDPVRNRGIMVGDHWKDRLDCRQWGVHFPHVAGIAGQSSYGAQSVVLSGGYEDDRDEGEWFLYTGSGGRDLSGNKRTNKIQSSDQVFTSSNMALLTSCQKGYPVRVVRSYKEKRSSYAPTQETPVRYDGIYRILRCWRKPGMQGKLVCRYLFVRADNSPAPWTSNDDGDSVNFKIPAEALEEMEAAKKVKQKVYQMGDEPHWSWLEDKKCWGWAKPAPRSQKAGSGSKSTADPTKRARAKLNEHEKALKEFKCGVCKGILNGPIRTPCGHNFCKGCLDNKFQGVSDIIAPTNGKHSLRVRKVQKPCPCCNADIGSFLATAQVNREMSEVITKLQAAIAAAKEEAEKLQQEQVSGSNDDEAADNYEDDVEQEDVDEDVEDEEEQSVEAAAVAGTSDVADKDLEACEAAPADSNKKRGRPPKVPKAAPASKPSKSKATAAEAGPSKQQAKTADPAAKRQRKNSTSQKGKENVAPTEKADIGLEVMPSTEEPSSSNVSSGDQAQHTVEAVHEAGEEKENSAAAVPLSETVTQPQIQQPNVATAQASDQKKYKYELELKTLLEEFPTADECLVRGFLDDQSGDLRDVRFMLRKLSRAENKKPTSKKRKANEAAAGDGIHDDAATDGKGKGTKTGKRGRGKQAAEGSTSSPAAETAMVEEQEHVAAEPGPVAMDVQVA